MMEVHCSCLVCCPAWEVMVGKGVKSMITYRYVENNLLCTYGDVSSRVNGESCSKHNESDWLSQFFFFRTNEFDWS